MSSEQAALRPLPEAIVYGTVCLDRFFFVNAAGESLSGEAVTLHEMPGGEAFNTATALAGWDVSVLLTGTAIGNDAESDRLRHLLGVSHLARGIDLHLLPEAAHAVTPVCTVRVFPDGERHMSGRGFAQAVAPPPIPPEYLASHPLFITDPNLGEAAVVQALAAQAAGCPVIAMDFADVPEIIRISRVLVTSHERLTRQGFADRSPESVVKTLCAIGSQTAIVTLGANGCIVADREQGIFSQPACTVPGIVDTTGAGDTFRARIAFGLLKKFPLRTAIRFACAAAALHCTTLGGGSRPPLSHVTALSAA